MAEIISQSNIKGGGDWVDRSIQTNDTVAAQDIRFVKQFQKYTVASPHPGFGKDPNIINEYGHTKYPKMVKKLNGESVIVLSEAEENEALGKAPVELRQDGPTIAEYVAAGFDPSNYPPKGYASKSTEEEIELFKKKHTKSGW